MEVDGTRYTIDVDINEMTDEDAQDGLTSSY